MQQTTVLPAPLSGLHRQFAHVLEESRPRVIGIFLLRFTAAAALSNALGWHFAAGALAWALMTVAIYVVNGIADRDGDQLNGSRRPIASGRLPLEVATGWVLALTVASLGIAIMISTPFALLTLGFGALGTIYSVGPRAANRNSWSAGAVVMSGGLLTYLAGHSLGGQWGSELLAVVAIAMTAWMAVGSLVKDLTDIAGDKVLKRKTLAVHRGPGAVCVIASAVATGVFALVLTVAAVHPSPELWIISAIIGVGVIGLVIAMFQRASWGERAPYNVFMTTQYVTHLAVLSFAF